MDLTVPDYAIMSLTVAGAIVGLFIGVSGAFAFLAGLAAATVSGVFLWPLSASFVSTLWLRGLAVGVLALLAFGLARWLVRKFVHGLVAQPGDALLGSLLSAVAGAAVSLGGAWALTRAFPENPDAASVLLERLLVLVGR